MERVGRLEAIVGVAAGIYGVAVTVAATLIIKRANGAPCGMPETACIGGINSITVTFLMMFGALFLGVAIGAFAHGQAGAAGAVGVLWLCSVMLSMLTVLGMFSIGIFVAPGTLAALVASCFALASLIEDRLSPRRWGELAAGGAAGVLGIVALVFVFFFPTIQYNGPDRGGSFSVADFYGLGKVLPAFLTFGVVAFLVAAGAASNAVRGSRTGRVLVALAGCALAAVAIVSPFVDDTAFYLHTVGLWLLPSLTLTLIAAAFAFVGPSRRAPAATA